MFTLPFTILFLILACTCGSYGSGITTFTDGQCKKSHDALDVKNGYPDGVCTPLNIKGNLAAFQIVQLDPDCAVTLYGPDDSSGQICSSSLRIVGQLATCYNSSWVYFSIDGCSKPNSSSIIVLPPATSTSSSSRFSSTSTASSSSSSSASLSSTSTAASATSTSADGSEGIPTAPLVGAIVGSVAVCAVFIGLLVLCLHRRKMSPGMPQQPVSYELSPDRALVEIPRSSVALPRRTAHKEMWGHEAAIEIGRNSYMPAVELPAQSWGEDKKRGSALIHVHMAR